MILTHFEKTRSQTINRCNIKFFFFKFWRHDATLFRLFLIFYDIHTSIQSHSNNTFIRHHSSRSLSISSSPLSSAGKPPCGAEPRIELGHALQQADALPTEPRCTIKTPFQKLFFRFFSRLLRLCL